jgi:hypothetical protein
VAVLVDYVQHPQGGEQGCVLEVFNALGESIAVVAVPDSDIEELRADEVLSVRPLARAGKPRKPGGWEGQVVISEDFDAPLPDDLGLG